MDELAKAVPAFVTPLFAFIDSALANNSSVLVHCLAGAHRAGTTGCLCLMHYESLDPKGRCTRMVVLFMMTCHALMCVKRLHVLVSV